LEDSIVSKSYLEELLAEGWGVKIGLSWRGNWDVVMAQSVMDLNDPQEVKAYCSGMFSDLDEALQWCKSAMVKNDLRPRPMKKDETPVRS
jgi:hypothetical protein